MVFLFTYARSCKQSIVVLFCLQPHKCVTLVCVRIQHGCKCCFLFSCCVLQIFKLGIVFLLSQKCVTLVLFQFNMVLPLSFLLMVHLLASWRTLASFIVMSPYADSNTYAKENHPGFFLSSTAWATYLGHGCPVHASQKYVAAVNLSQYCFCVDLLRVSANNPKLYRVVCSIRSVLLWFVSEFNMVINVPFFIYARSCKQSIVVLFCLFRKSMFWVPGWSMWRYRVPWGMGPQCLWVIKSGLSGWIGPEGPAAVLFRVMVSSIRHQRSLFVCWDICHDSSAMVSDTFPWLPATSTFPTYSGQGCPILWTPWIRMTFFILFRKSMFWVPWWPIWRYRVPWGMGPQWLWVISSGLCGWIGPEGRAAVWMAS